MILRELSIPPALRHWLYRTFKRQQYQHEMAVRWQAGITPETDFWDNYIATRGGLWPEDFQLRMDPALHLQEHITEILDIPLGCDIHVLDVGAGPLTYVGKIWPGYKINITAVDPLADEYNQMFQKYGITPLVMTQAGKAEELVARFGTNRFDLVHARNCIDHAHDPVRAIEQMVSVAKPGGIVHLHHAVNEADTEGYCGFHQWNFHGTTEWFYISNQMQTINMTLRLAPVATITNKILGGNKWIITTIHKRPPSSLWARLYYQIKINLYWLQAKLIEKRNEK